MKSGLKIFLGFAAGAAAGYFIAKNSDKLADCFDEICYKIDDLRDQFDDYRCRCCDGECCGDDDCEIEFGDDDKADDEDAGEKDDDEKPDGGDDVSF